MNKTVVLLHLVISTTLTKPIDEAGVIEDGYETIKTTEVRVSNDENLSRLVNIDDLLSDSEMFRMYGAQNIISATRRLKETENNNREHVNDEQLNSSVAKLLQRDKSDGTSLESKSSSEHKTGKEVESSTMNIEMDGRTADYLEDLANEKFELYNKEVPSGEALERIHVEFETVNPESNTEWDMLDDIPIHRRMINPKTIKEEEMTKTGLKHDSKSSTSSESKSVEDVIYKSPRSSESKSVEDVISKSPRSSESKNVEDVNSKSSSSSESKSVEDINSKSSSSSENKSVEDFNSKRSISSESKSVEGDRLSKNIEKERLHFAPNDESNVEWDKLDDFPITRRMTNPKSMKVAEIMKVGSKDSNPKGSSSSESKSVEDVNPKSSSSAESKSVEDDRSKSSKSKIIVDNSSKSSESKSVEDDNLSKSIKKERIHFKFEVPNDESSTERNMLSDIPISRRMLNPKNIKVEENKKTGPKDDNSKSSSSTESKSVEYDNISKSSKKDSPYDTSGYGSKESQNDDKTSKRVEDHIDSDAMSMILKKELLKELMTNKNAERENSKSVEDENARVNERKSVDALKYGGHHLNEDVLKMPKAYENLRPRVLHNHATLEGLRRNQPIQYQPIVPVNPATVAIPGINQRSIIVPAKVQKLISKESLEKSLESSESKTVDDFNYKRDSNAYPYTPDPNKTNYIYSKLLEASENAHMHRNGGISPRYVPINNLKVQYGLPNPNTFKYPPNIRPLSMPS